MPNAGTVVRDPRGPPHLKEAHRRFGVIAVLPTRLSMTCSGRASHMPSGHIRLAVPQQDPCEEAKDLTGRTPPLENVRLPQRAGRDDREEDAQDCEPFLPAPLSGTSASAEGWSLPNWRLGYHP